MRLLLRTHPTDEFWDQTRHAILDLDVELARLLIDRHRAFAKAKKADPDLVEAHYVDGSVTYYDDLVPEDVLDDASVETFWDQGWVELPSGINLENLTEARTDGTYLIVGRDYVQWVCSPKQASLDVLTEALGLEVLKNVL